MCPGEREGGPGGRRTFLFSSLYAVMAFLCRSLCSLSLDKARWSARRRNWASAASAASCSLSASRFSSICRFSCSSKSFLQEEEAHLKKTHTTTSTKAKPEQLCGKKKPQMPLVQVKLFCLPALFSLAATSVKWFPPRLVIPGVSHSDHHHRTEGNSDREKRKKNLQGDFFLNDQFLFSITFFVTKVKIL